MKYLDFWCYNDLYALGETLKRINNLIQQQQLETEKAKKKFYEQIETLNKNKSCQGGLRKEEK